MVLYFTGTGNSRYLAERIAGRLSMPVYDLNVCIKTGNTKPVKTGPVSYTHLDVYKRQTHDYVPSYIAAEAGAVVINVEYRLAPEYKFHRGLEDCYEACKWAIEHKDCLLYTSLGAAAISGIQPFNGFASKWLIYQAAYTKAAETGNFYYLIITITALVVSVMTLAS